MQDRSRSYAALLGLAAAYCLASLVHFVHNAEFLAQYPNLPAWLSRPRVYGAWLLVTAVGVTGVAAARSRFVLTGLVLVAVYAALGFDGLGHYALAPVSAHTLAMNLTIGFEVLAASVLQVFTMRQVFLAGRHLAGGAARSAR